MRNSKCWENVGNEKPQSIDKQQIGASISDPDRIQTCNRWSRNPVRYSVAPRGHFWCGATTCFNCQLRHGAIFGVEQLHVLIVSCATGPFQRSLKQLKPNRTYQVKLLHVERIRGTKITLLPKLPT